MGAKGEASSSVEAAIKRKHSANGASKATKRSKTAEATTSSETATLPLGKALASTEKRVRDGAVRSLTSFLEQNGAHSLSDLELRKLWKGIFYCFWMSDKPLVQQKLAQQLADLVLVRPKDSSSRAQSGLAFLEGFWDVLLSEWAGLDKHRIDKFYLLVRRFVQVGFRLLAEEKWEPEAVSRFTAMFRKAKGALNTNDPNVPDSLTYHLADVYLAELEKALELISDAQTEHNDEGETAETEDDDLPLVPTVQLLQPFIDALATAKSKQMYDRIWSTVFEPLLEDTLRAADRAPVEEETDFEDIEDEEEEDASEEEDNEEEEAEGEAGDETSNTVFHSFADESTISAADDVSDSSDTSSDSEDNEDVEDDVQFPLLLALSAVPLPSSMDEDDLDDALDSEQEVDVALLLRSAIFKSLFVTASQADATEARRRNLYELWRNEQDRINDTPDKTQVAVESAKEETAEDDEEEEDDE